MDDEEEELFENHEVEDIVDDSEDLVEDILMCSIDSTTVFVITKSLE